MKPIDVYLNVASIDNKTENPQLIAKKNPKKAKIYNTSTVSLTTDISMIRERTTENRGNLIPKNYVKKFLQE